MARISDVQFSFNENIECRFASYGLDHLCIIFYVGGERRGSFVAETPNRTDYFSELTQTATYSISLQDAIRQCERENGITPA